jgi:hypothetical protein
LCWFFFLKWDLRNYLLGLASNLDPHDFCLLTSQAYRRTWAPGAWLIVYNFDSIQESQWDNGLQFHGRGREGALGDDLEFGPNGGRESWWPQSAEACSRRQGALQGSSEGLCATQPLRGCLVFLHPINTFPMLISNTCRTRSANHSVAQHTFRGRLWKIWGIWFFF